MERKAVSAARNLMYRRFMKGVREKLYKNIRNKDLPKVKLVYK
jgi:hypothetical protein